MDGNVTGVPVSRIGYGSDRLLKSILQVRESEANFTTSFEDRLQHLPLSRQWAIDSWAGDPASVQNFGEAIRTKTAVAMSDGSVRDPLGTSSFALSNTSESFYITGENRIPQNCISSHRAELGGALGILIWVAELISHQHITTGSLEIGLDGKNAVQALTKDFVPTQSKDYDMLQLALTIRQTLPIKISFRWVEGHQDDHTDVTNLDLWGRLNVMAHNRATAYWSVVTKPRENNVPMNPYSLYYDTKWVQNLSLESIYDELRGNMIGDHWINLGSLGIHEGNFFLVDWESWKQGTDRLPWSIRLHIAKSLAKFSPTGVYMHRTYYEDSSCPRCGASNEDFLHVIQCQDLDATTLWNKLFPKIEKWIRQNTSEELGEATRQCLDCWRENLPVPICDTWSVATRKVMEAQAALGWSSFMFGRLTPECNIATTCTDAFNHKKRWVGSLISKLFHLLWEFWEQRNDVLHDPSGQRISSEHDQVNNDVRLQFLIGFKDLSPEDRYLGRYDLDTIYK